MFTPKTTFQKGLILLFLLLVLVTSGIPAAHAQAGAPPPGGLAGTVTELMSIFAMINTFVHILILIILNLLGYLLQADFLNDPEMMSALNNIWQLSRNIMNVIFAVMLIFVAIYTIITTNSEMIKGKMANFIMAVILVNFSWFFPRVIIDVANVLTATVYSIPNTMGFTCQTFGGGPCEVVTDVIIMPKANQIADWQSRAQCGGAAVCTACTDKSITCYAKQNYNTISNSLGAAHAMINGMAVSFINIQAITKIPDDVDFSAPAGTMQIFTNTLKFAVNIMMTLFIQAAVILPLLGLAVGLFIRILILWVTTAFMPFTFLGFVINGKLGTNIFGFETDIWQEFINAAFLPAVVAIPFVIGFIMLSTVSQIPMPEAFPQTWGFPLLSGIGSWWKFLWMFAAIGIIWTGSFAALARSKITGKFTERIKGFGDAVFRAGLQLPLIVPLPVGIGPKGTNLGTIVNGPRMLGNRINRAALGLPDPKPEEAAAIKAANVERLGTADADRHTREIVEAIQTLAKSDASKGDRETALRKIHIAVESGQNLSEEETLRQLQGHIQKGNNVDLKGKLGDLARAIEESKKK